MVIVSWMKEEIILSQRRIGSWGKGNLRECLDVKHTMGRDIGWRWRVRRKIEILWNVGIA